MNPKNAVKRALMHFLKLHKPMTRNAPTPQNMADIFKGEWASRFPAPFDSINAGTVPVFEDSRIAWAIQAMRGVDGFSVLELGPMEGGHSYMLEKAGAASITAIEANPSAFLKCLVVKELLQLQRTRFQFGDFMKYFESNPPRVDAIFASGVLYHMENPVSLINQIAGITDRVYIWTQYYQADSVQRLPELAKQFVSHDAAEYAGFKFVSHRREYTPALNMGRFYGGTENCSVWLTLEDLVGALKHAGLENIQIQFDDPNHAHGPCVSLLASRESVSRS